MYKAFALAGMLVVAALTPVAWPDEPACHDKKPAAGKKDFAETSLARLKKLVGEWEASPSSDQTAAGKLLLSYRLTGGGTAVAETIFPGTDMEMLSVYHRDGDQLVLTHYCAAGNQPHMKAKAGKNDNELTFEFTGGSNLDPAKDMHIHGGVFRFVDDDHFHCEWEVYADGKASAKHSFDLVRRKK